ncbi:ribonuclease T2 [Chromobacterium alkanivorans]|uniref:ribonuclease T2 family protein n=1 Tax=Chromobacterium alkanivorans TaxID=1071719 RepID=UPI0021687E13|nr:ribonuclease [Chromobacterium alkanivorans]MCS3806180.1 ribonuclease T2 [Chromobacterium alkanivorans]MCS3820418.1 ribonuclease T2 [Chromobacterium alkanivorans]MCS3875176.1 ribonuclease T2 [Chromobacterium alkanivorans]
MRQLLVAALAALLTFSLPAAAKRHHGHHPAMSAASADAGQQHGQPGVFDYYALSLSWAPSYCASHPQDASECGQGKRYGFVLHGLWPQYLQGWPQFCSEQALPPDVEQRYANLFPSPRLMEHEWSKHGTCSGLAPDAYMRLAGQLQDEVKLPDAYRQPMQAFRTTSAGLAQSFYNANPQLPAGSVLAVCSGQFLSEVHVCFNHDGGQAQACSPSETKQSNHSCQGGFLVRNVR